MRLSANFATYPGAGRPKALQRAVESIIDQVDVVRIYWNQYERWQLPEWSNDPRIENQIGEDLTDNGKFEPLHRIKGREIYLTCDDSILYPPDYSAYILANITDHPVLSFHGRQLRTDGNYLNSYYFGGHHLYSYRDDVYEVTPVDVVGTGVMAFDTEVFDPRIAYSKYKKMSDLVVSLEAARQGVEMVVLPHIQDWLKPIRLEQSIHNDFHMKPQPQQIELVKEIIKLRRG